MFPRLLVLLLLCISRGFAATLIQASVEGTAADGSVLPRAEADEASVNNPAAGDFQAEDILLANAHVEEKPAETQEPEDDSDWGFNSIRGGFQSMNGYFDSILELMGGKDGVCQYRCRYGKAPQPRSGYQMPEPDGCSTTLLGFQVPDSFDMGVPAMTKCCNQLDVCYDTCGSSKYRCDTKFRWCLHSICGDLKKSLGFMSKVEACETFADTMYNTVWTLGCRPFMNSQRAACYCEGEQKDEL
ncbi:group XIIB secretory phospholipase A2-like protein isoform X1 [Xyrauchen texanus]|uniref:group XIIB secretory phospholipase A2-like protein isoform X1 n=1 Tax=Xyrauchen texanus TaxID=154827 RepID=UPI002241F495|nr:group XIIB secretory phospholipase A2-like protein isoform X1 [Xyrauchen texanus]XP_052007285.1 group XIIB secretory phospholipase A2-like protein isoform X1 [Xyrauchen texanus]